MERDKFSENQDGQNWAKIYENHIRFYPRLAEAEERALAEEIKRHRREPTRQQAIHTLVNSNLRLAYVIAKGFRGTGVEFWDLVQYANMGLQRAAEFYDPAKASGEGSCFGTFASVLIRQAIWAGIQKEREGLIVEVEGVKMTPSLINRKEVELGHRLKREPSMEEVASAIVDEKHPNLQAEDKEDLAQRIAVTIRRIQPHQIERLGDQSDEVPDPRPVSADGRAIITEALQQLGAKDRELMKLRFWEELSFREIAWLTGLSPVTVRVRIFRARSRLKRWLDKN